MAGYSRTPQTTAPGTPATPSAGRNKTQTLETTTDGKPRFQGCSGIKAYEVLDKLGEGTFGEVFKGRHRAEGSLFAMKKILTHNEKDGFPITALREIRLLKLLSHPNILVLKEMVVEHVVRAGKPKSIMYMIMPYMSHDLSGLLENPTVKITEPIIKCYMLQLLKGVKYLHDQRILHRDMKAANLLINNHGLLQIADFGLARQYDEEPPKPNAGGGVANRDYTALVVTRWYRPPELLLGLRKYTTAIDLWGVGCVFGEMFKHKPILAGGTDLIQAEMIFELVGSPTEQNMPGWNELSGCEGVKNFPFRRGKLEEVFRQYSTKLEFLDLMKQFLTLDWRKRITAVDALEHPYFRVSPLPIQPYQIPQFEESHELDRRKFRENAALPPAPAGGTVGIGGHAQGEWGANPPGDWQNGHGRRPDGPPPNARGHHNNSYGDRGPGHGGNERRPPRGGGGGWGNGTRDNGPRGAPDTALPPRPPPAQDAPAWRGGGAGAAWQNQDIPVGRQPRGREPMNGRGPRDVREPPGGGPGAAGNRDTYIPSYEAGDRPPRYDRRDGREPDRGRRPTGGGAGLDYGDGAQRRDDRERTWERGPERNRSRSPGRRPPMNDRNRDRSGYGRR